MSNRLYLVAVLTLWIAGVGCSTSGQGGGTGGGGGEGGQEWSTATGSGAGPAGTSWEEHCQQRGENLAACGENFDVAGCIADGPCLQNIFRTDAMKAYIACRLNKDCQGHNCFTEAAATLTLTDAQKTYLDACNQRASCDSGSVDWDWCSSDFAWNLMNDTFIQELTTCFSIAACVDAHACLNKKVDMAFASCP